MCPCQVNQKHDGNARVVGSFAVGALLRVATVQFPDVLLRNVLCVLDASLRNHGGVAHDEQHPRCTRQHPRCTRQHPRCTRHIGPIRHAISRRGSAIVASAKQIRAQRAAQVALAGELVQENAGRLNARVRQRSDEAVAAAALVEAVAKHVAAQRRQVCMHLLV